MLVGVVVAVAAVTYAIVRFAPSPSSPPVANATLPTSAASYLGVYEHQTPHSFQLVANFATVAGRQPNLVGYYSGWKERFATSFAETVRGHGAVTILQMDPTGVSIAAIAAGRYDAYLRSFADSVRNYGHAVVIGFGHEMNAPWYSWGYGHTSPTAFVAAWQHVVTVFRKQGADNVTWLWTLQADGPGTGPVASWWPGAQYVSWIGIDGYYYRPSDTFASVFGKTIKQVRTFTSRPVLLSETAVGPAAGQFNEIQNLFRGMVAYKTLGLVWFDKAQHDGINHQDWRLEDNPFAEGSFRVGVREDLAPGPPAN